MKNVSVIGTRTQRYNLFLTDYGSLQKKAFFLKTLRTLRNEVEWVDLVASGFNMLAGSDKAGIVAVTTKMRNVVNSDDKELYGYGQACVTIVESL